LRLAPGNFDFAVIVAVVAVGMVKVSIHQIVNVVAMRHGFVSAIRSMNVVFAVAAAVVSWSTDIGILGRHLQDMFVNVIPVHVVQMPVVEIIHVPVVLDPRVAAAGPMLVRVTSVLVALRHGRIPWEKETERARMRFDRR
jgi:hypothetical protein